MIEIKELYITPDNTNLIISACIESLSIYDDVTLNTVKIDNQNTFVNPNYPSNNAIEVYNKDGSLPIDYDTVHDSNNRIIKLVIPINALMDNTSNNLFYVYIEADIDEASELLSTDCGYDVNIKMNPVINDFIIYNLLIGDIKSNTTSDCKGNNVTTSFANNFIKYQLVETALKAGKYSIANTYWNKYFSSPDILTFKTTYSCHG